MLLLVYDRVNVERWDFRWVGIEKHSCRILGSGTMYNYIVSKLLINIVILDSYDIWLRVIMAAWGNRPVLGYFFNHKLFTGWKRLEEEAGSQVRLHVLLSHEYIC